MLMGTLTRSLLLLRHTAHNFKPSFHVTISPCLKPATQGLAQLFWKQLTNLPPRIRIQKNNLRTHLRNHRNEKLNCLATKKRKSVPIFGNKHCSSEFLHKKVKIAAAGLIFYSHEFYHVIPNVCEGSYKKSALYQISPFARDDMLQSIISASYENS